MAPLPTPSGVSDRAWRRLSWALSLLAVSLASLAGGLLALTAFQQDERLSVGTVRLSVQPFHAGALDLYVPLVDWGVRFSAVRFPARLHADVRAVDRRSVQRIAQAGSLDITLMRHEARNAIARYLRTLIGVSTLSAVALGLLVMLALRTRAGPRLRWGVATAVVVSLAWAVALAVLLPPRGAIDDPQYYAFGPDIPRALNAVESVQRSTRNLDQELDLQLVGLARLVLDPGRREPLAGRPTVTIASDLHNNVLALSTLEQAAGRGPLLFPGDLTDRGTPLETSLIRRVVGLGHPFVFVSGNHDSDTLEATLARSGAIVLTESGRLKPDGSHGPVIADVGGLRIAGYSDPFERRSAEDFRDRYDNSPTPAMQERFLAWVQPLLGKVDVIMVHEPALIEPTLAVLRDHPPPRPIVFVVGHTHQAAVEHFPGVAVINGGSVGAGGTGNLTERTPIGVARMIYTLKPSFQALAADLVSIDPGTGSATAERQRLDAGGTTSTSESR
jgi:predicted phosphodiesterase